MRELRVVGLGEDTATVVLEDPIRHERFVVPSDERLRAAARGDVRRLGQMEIETTSPLRPRDIQARIRGGRVGRRRRRRVPGSRWPASSGSPTRCCSSGPASPRWPAAGTPSARAAGPTRGACSRSSRRRSRGAGRTSATGRGTPGRARTAAGSCRCRGARATPTTWRTGPSPRAPRAGPSCPATTRPATCSGLEPAPGSPTGRRLGRAGRTRREVDDAGAVPARARPRRGGRGPRAGRPRRRRRGGSSPRRAGRRADASREPGRRRRGRAPGPRHRPRRRAAPKTTAARTPIPRHRADHRDHGPGARAARHRRAAAGVPQGPRPARCGPA